MKVGLPNQYIFMGVTGCGKTTLGRAWSEAIGGEFYDADDFHPEANLRKMSRGIPLTDEDRQPWLRLLRELLEVCQQKNQTAVLACSALRESYRKILDPEAGQGTVSWIYLKASQGLIEQRLALRKGHFMPAGLIPSQFATLEEPSYAFGVPADLSVSDQIKLLQSR